MNLPTEFLTLSESLTLGVMGVVLFLIVQATKELPVIAKLPTLLYAWGLGALLLFVGTAVRGGVDINWGETVYLSVINGIIVAAFAVLTHQGATRFGIIKEEVK